MLLAIVGHSTVSLHLVSIIVKRIELFSFEVAEILGNW
jgi:hypothetical protein